jgi:peptidoglycan/xylan/chitin deacetylase (PgdA/CDA1 family)
MALPTPVYRRNTNTNVIYLTFDDGPYVGIDTMGNDPSANSQTVLLVDKLWELREAVNDPLLSATFFFNGWGFERERKIDDPDPDAPAAVERRAIAAEILRQGHDIANHSYFHKNPWGTLDNNGNGVATVAGMVEEVEKCRKAFRRLDAANKPGKLQSYLRSPGDPSYWPTGDEKQGKRISAQRVWPPTDPPKPKQKWFRKILQATQACDMTYVTYNIWSKDNALGLTPEWVYWHVIDATKAPPPPNPPRGVFPDPDKLSFELLPENQRTGAIILMHNGRQASVDALGAFGSLPGIIPYLYSKNYIIRRLPPPPLAPG